MSTTECKKTLDNNKDEKYGKVMANCHPGEEVVITGMAGKFPISRNVKEYADNLYNKVDMVTPSTRWPEMVNVPKRNGQLYDLEKFDNGFFGMPYWIAEEGDPVVRLFLERAIEAIFDAGINPKELEGTKTGVFMGVCHSETEPIRFQHNNFTGTSRSMAVNRVSYFLKLKGPSYIVDTACSSSMYALEHAYRAIRSGECDAAIVGGGSLCLHPNVSFQFYTLGVLSMDGASKSFDDSGNGYARSEAVCAIFLQKSKDAKRIYGKIIHAKTVCDGYKEKGITFPSGEMQAQCLKECYEEANVHPNEISYIEAHGTGTVVGDPEEAKALDDVLCKVRDKPLLIGSCKSNIGHSEASSGLCSIIKCLIAFENGFIPPTLHYTKPRAGIKALEEGRLKVVAETTPLPRGKCIIGVSSFGFGGADCHIILSNFEKEKNNRGVPKDNLPRLVCVSGRVPETITQLLNQVSAKGSVDAEFVRFLHEVFRYNIQGHFYRGFSIVSKNGEIYRSQRQFVKKPPQLIFKFCGFDNNWDIIGEQLFQLPLFAATVQKVYDILISKNINIVEILNQKRQKSLEEQILGNITVQLGLVDIIKTVNIEPDYVIGYGIHELITAYQEGVLTLKQVLESACIVTSYLREDPLEVSVYSVELKSDSIKKVVPISVTVQDLSENRSIVYCPKQYLEDFLNSIKSNGIQLQYLGVKMDYINCIDKEKLIDQFNKIITKPNQWTSKHLLCPNQMANSEHFANYVVNFFSSSIFKKIIKNRSIILEFGSSNVVFLIGENILTKVDYLQTVMANQSLTSLLKCLGRLYEEGFNMDVHNIYPEVQFPVSRTTPSISSSIKWKHDKNWFVAINTRAPNSTLEEREFKFHVKHPDWNFLTGHNIDGRNLFPAAGYIRLAWEALAVLENKIPDLMKIVIRNCRFTRATTIPKDSTLALTVMIQKATGNFEILEGTVAVVKGNIRNVEEGNPNLNYPQWENYENEIKMTTKDIYKELRLRGYNYTGGFRAIKECNISATDGLIKWEDNWISFIDNMFQMKILQIDTRFLYVPTVITKLTINAKEHTEFIKSLGEDTYVPVHVFQEADLIKSGGIEVRGLKANSIARRKDLSDPVLEKHQFIPNHTNNLSLAEAIRVNVQILLENNFNTKLKIVELIDEATDPNKKPLAPIINEAVGDQPVVNAETIILSSQTEYENTDKITIENKPLVSQFECNLVVGTTFLSRPIILQQAFRVLKENCYILSREPKDIDLKKINKDDVTIITAFPLENECLVLLSKPKRISIYEVVDVNDTKDFSWLQSIKNLKNDCNVIILSQNDNINGILGLVNCLRRELNPDKIKCIFLMERAPAFNLNEKFYAEQLEKNMAINVYKNGQWGTYRHLKLENETIENCDHSFVNVNSPGDLSSMSWVQGHLNRKKLLSPEKSLVNVYYSAINFRDVMTASGKINIDVITMNRLLQGCVQGFEFTGKLQNGDRVMGMSIGGTLATLIETDNVFLWPIPATWSMKDAATVPVCYSTVTWAMLQVGKMKKGDKVLIHSGTGGIGQAAIRLALYTGCTVFTTVGTPEKREFLKKQFPQLKDSNIASSRDLSFVSHILKETNGKGVDMVLNSLAEEKLLGSVRCLAQKGKFLEIGKFDLANNNPLKLELIKKNASFHGVMLDQFFNADPSIKLTINNIIKDLIKAGAIEPLNTNIFEAQDVEGAFRYMGAGKHIGKVLVEVRKENSDGNNIVSNPNIKTVPRYYCEENDTSIIIGGLGGFGLELADWLILRGARKLILTSRNGVQNGYQAYRIRIWESYGVNVVVSTVDVTTREGCLELLKTANKLGSVEAIFNLAVVLKDAVVENQDEEAFKTSFAPKAVATMYLDEISRKICPNLRTFVVFSSVSCGRGNAGQTNYGMANSVMERICEKRKQEGYPGLAIQWGAVGDVGLVADMQEEHKELEIGGTLQQKIFNCLKVMDNFLTQKHAPVVSSMVVADKRIGGSENMIDVVADILGIKDLKAVSLQSTFPEIGMDSMSAVEIKQTLERDYEVFLTAEDIRGMSFARLQEIQESRLGEDKIEPVTEFLGGFDFLLRLIGDEELNNIPILNLKSKFIENKDVEPVLFFPGIEGVATVLDPLVQNLYVKAIGVQFGCVYEKDTIRELAEAMIPYITSELKSKTFKFVAYSFGVTFTLEIVSILECLGYKGTLICIDGSPQYLKQLTKIMDADSDDKLQTSLICKMLSMRIKLEEVEKVKPSIMDCKSLDERVALAQDFVDEKLKNGEIISHSHLRQLIVSTYKRIKSSLNYSPSFSKINSKVVLFKSEFISLPGLSPDYELSKVCGQNIKVIGIKANHATILESPIVAEYINDEFAIKEDENNNDKQS